MKKSEKRAIVYSYRSVFFEDLIDGFGTIKNPKWETLMYSLHTLRKFNKDIPVKLFIDSPSLNHSIEELSVKEFENVEIVRFDCENLLGKNIFTHRDDEYGWEHSVFHKWPSAITCIENYELDRVLFLDVDTIFYDDVSKIFDNYSVDKLWFQKDSYPTEIWELLEFKVGYGINDGVFLLPQEAAKKLKDIYVDLFKETRKELLDKQKSIEFQDWYGLTAEHWMNNTRWVTWQYTSQKILEKLSIPFDLFKIDSVVNALEHLESTSVLRHYFNGNWHEVAPAKKVAKLIYEFE